MVKPMGSIAQMVEIPYGASSVIYGVRDPKPSHIYPSAFKLVVDIFEERLICFFGEAAAACCHDSDGGSVRCGFAAWDVLVHREI
jgi:hypothetical protein